MPEDAVSLKAWADAGPAFQKQAAVAIPDFEKAVSLSDFPLTEAMLGLGHAVAGRRADAMRVLGKLREWSKHRYVPAWAFLCIYRTLGDAEETFRWLDIAYRAALSCPVCASAHPRTNVLSAAQVGNP